MNNNEIRDLVSLVKSNWTHVSVDESLLKAWQIVLMNVDYVEATQVVLEFVQRNEPEAPTPRHILAALNGTTKTTESEVWEMLQKCVARFGSYRLPRSIQDLNYHSLQQEAEQLGVTPDVFDFGTRFGWMELCVSENPDVMRGHVCRAWRDEDTNTLRRHEVEREENLVEIMQHNNLALQSGVYEPVIGDDDVLDEKDRIKAIIARARASI